MKVYPLGIVGESNYQPAIKRSHAGEVVSICTEPDNPYDNLALRVENNLGETIGYIPRDCWLRDAIHEQGRGVTAAIFSIAKGDSGHLGVVLNVTLTDDDLPEREYGQKAPPRRGIFRRLFD